MLRAVVAPFLRVAAAVAVIVLVSGTGEAQSPPQPPAGDFPRFEIAVLGGYRFESTLTFQNAASPYDRVEIDDAPTWGITLGWNHGPSSELEIQYSYARPKATAIAKGSGAPTGTFDIGINDIQLAWVGNLYRPQDTVRPYFGLGLGATLLDTNQSLGSDTKVSLSISAGVKVYLGGHVGLRAEVHYVPAYLYTTKDGVVWCFYGAGGSCWNTGDRYLQQLDLRAGATFRF